MQTEEWVEQVVKRATDSVCLKIQETICPRIESLEKSNAELHGKLNDGIEARVRNIERMQWWQIGIMVAIIGGLIGGTLALARENQKLLREHINPTQKVAPAEPGGEFK